MRSDFGKAVQMSGSPSIEQLNNMHPTDVVNYWMAGHGGSLYFGPDSIMSNQLGSVPRINDYLTTQLYDKYGGNLPSDAFVKADVPYDWFPDALNLNPAMQVVGTFKGSVQLQGDMLVYKAANNMSVSSLTFGNARGKYIEQHPDAAWPMHLFLGKHESDLNMTIEWQRPLKK